MTRENQDNSSLGFFPGFIMGVVITVIAALLLINSAFFAQTTPKEIVNCGDYQKITDKYRIVDGGYYIVTGDTTHSVLEYTYNHAIIGQYARITKIPQLGGSPVFIVMDFRNLTPLDQNETDYRGACKVVP